MSDREICQRWSEFVSKPDHQKYIDDVHYKVSITKIDREDPKQSFAEVNKIYSIDSYHNLIDTFTERYILKLEFNDEYDDFKDYKIFVKNLTKEEAQEWFDKLDDEDDKLIFNAVRNNENYEFLKSDFIERKSNKDIIFDFHAEKVQMNNDRVFDTSRNYLKKYQNKLYKKELKRLIDTSRNKDKLYTFLETKYKIEF